MGSFEEARKGIGGELHPGVVRYLKGVESKKK
jgi:hypothetical protein